MYYLSNKSRRIILQLYMHHFLSSQLSMAVAPPPVGRAEENQLLCAVPRYAQRERECWARITRENRGEKRGRPAPCCMLWLGDNQYLFLTPLSFFFPPFLPISFLFVISAFYLQTVKLEKQLRVLGMALGYSYSSTKSFLPLFLFLTLYVPEKKIPTLSPAIALHLILPSSQQCVYTACHNYLL